MSPVVPPIPVKADVHAEHTLVLTGVAVPEPVAILVRPILAMIILLHQPAHPEHMHLTAAHLLCVDAYRIMSLICDF